MTDEGRPLLAFNPPHVPEGGRVKPKGHPLPKVAGPGGKRQGERLGPKFTELVDAFAAQRVEAGTDTPTEVDPSLVIVLDLAGSVPDFHKAVDKIQGLEFLAEMLGDEVGPDDDFYMKEGKKARTDKPVQHSLYLAMTNAKAVDQLISLFKRWQEDPAAEFEHGLAKFKNVFAQLVDIRRWGPEDRIRETGLLRHWRETLAVVGQSYSPVRVEVELWYHRDRGRRYDAEHAITRILDDCGGKIVSRARIEEIGYHALLVDLPRQQVQTVLERGPQAIRLLTAEDVMFVSPFEPMSICAPHPSETSSASFPAGHAIDGRPRIALLDGLPMQNHEALAGRLLVDDADGVEGDYQLAARSHGTAMASLIIHGDLSAPRKPLGRPLYVRPIMQAEEQSGGLIERVSPDTLFVDLLHRAVRRLYEEEYGRPPWAPSVRIINLSIGDSRRPLIRRMSPVGRLIDWLALKYNVLFIVSAGNHTEPIFIPAAAAQNQKSARSAAERAVRNAQLLRGILPPGDSMNALTVGAVHADGAPDPAEPSTAWDLNAPSAPALYSATGPGVGNSVKPDLYHTGGRILFTRPVVPTASGSDVMLSPASTRHRGPGICVAAPDEYGSTNRTVFEAGTSHATALVTREASELFDALEDEPDQGTRSLPDALFHPLIVRALLAHSCSWGDWRKDIAPQSSRKTLTPLFGYGRLDPDRARGAINRAVVVAGNEIGIDERHTYDLPLPSSIRSKAEWHRFVITLAYWAPTTQGLNSYRDAKVYFVTPDKKLASGRRVDADHHAVRHGSLQHEVIDGYKAMTFNDGDVFPIHVECMRDGQKSGHIERIRYALVVSIETAATTSSIIYDEVRAGLIQMHDRAGIQQTDRVRVR